MTLPSSGGLTIAQILAEIGDSFPVTIPNANWRTLAGKPTGSLIIPTDFYGKSWRSVTQTDSRTTEATSHSAVSFGADVSGRQIVILVWHNDTSANPGQTPTATIGGVAATRVAAYSTGNGSGTAVGTAIFVAAPTGTSGTVAVTWGTQPVTIVALRLTGHAVPAFASGGHVTDGDTYALGVPANGLVIGMAGKASTGVNVAWTNLTEQGNDDASGSSRSWGWDLSLGAQTRSITYSPYSGTQGQNTFAVASFSPS